VEFAFRDTPPIHLFHHPLLLCRWEPKRTELAKLEDKLAKLTEQLLQFEAMKKQVEDERKKSEALAKEDLNKSSGRNRTHDQAQRRLKNPPVIVIASPAEGSTVEGQFILSIAK